MGVAGLAVSSCSRDEGEDSKIQPITIQNVAPSADFAVGVFYKNVGSGGQDATRYSRLMSKWENKGLIPGPNLDLWAGNYTLDQTNPYDDEIFIIQQQVDWSVENGIDFWILPALKAKQDMAAPDCVDGDYNMYDVVRGKRGSERNGTNRFVDMKGLKFVATINIEDPLCQSKWKCYDEDGNQLSKTTAMLGNTALLNDNDDIVSRVLDEDGNIVSLLKRSEVFAELFKSVAERYFSDEHYFRKNGHPVVVLQNAHKLYYSTVEGGVEKGAKGFYDYLRAAVKEVTGEDIYIIAQQEGAWNPPARGEYFFQGTDAIANKNMYLNSTWSRSLDYPSYIYYNWMYNRDYYMSNWGVDWVPTGAPSWNKYVDNGNGDQPIVDRDRETFATMCNVMKMSAGRDKIFFFDSFNDIQYCSFLEPVKSHDADGNIMDYGTLEENAKHADTSMLQVIKEQFKGK